MGWASVVGARLVKEEGSAAGRLLSYFTKHTASASESGKEIEKRTFPCLFQASVLAQ